MQLLNSTIFRLSTVLITFLAYGFGSLYFNYYLHDFNESTSAYFYELTKRNVYVVAINGMTRYVAITGNVYMLGRNNGMSRILYINNYS